MCRMVTVLFPTKTAANSMTPKTKSPSSGELHRGTCQSKSKGDQDGKRCTLAAPAEEWQNTRISRRRVATKLRQKKTMSEARAHSSQRPGEQIQSRPSKMSDKKLKKSERKPYNNRHKKYKQIGKEPSKLGKIIYSDNNKRKSG